MLRGGTPEKVPVLVSFPFTLIKYCDRRNLKEKGFVWLTHLGCSPSWKRKHSSRNLRDVITLHRSPEPGEMG